MVIYRGLSFIVNTFCAFIAISTIFLILFGLSNPTALLQCFLMISVVLYAWLAKRFFVSILVHQQKMTRKQKDWLQVNAIVAAIFSILGIGNSVYIFYSPDSINEVIKQMPLTNASTENVLINVAIVLLALCTMLLVHVIWTYILIRKYKEYFEPE